MEFDDILPHLASTYRRGLLVPFIGSGMSIPVCTGWLKLLVGLAREGGVALPENIQHYLDGKTDRAPETAELYRLADKAVMGLGSLDADLRAEAFRKALNASGSAPGTCAIPPQTQALARCYWPLVLTTNYDDLYVVSRMRQSRPAVLAGPERVGTASLTAKRDETDVPEVLGRSVEDCHKVLRSLDAPTRPILWALQGFLGGQAERPETLDAELILDEPRRRLLAGEVVAGHQQYQRAINAQPHFRRAFAEVFSRRSLLFLGSGILEDYLINLFGEIAHHYGPGPYPHFALFAREEFKNGKKAPPDERFFQTRLGITPVLYENYDDLKDLLGRLTDTVWERRSPPAAGARPVAWLPDELGFRLTDGMDRPSTDRPNKPAPEFAYPPVGESRRLRLRYAPLPVPAPGRGACVIVSSGRNLDNSPDLGRQGNHLLEGAVQAKHIPHRDPSQWRPTRPEHSLSYRYGDTPIFAVAARLPQTDPPPPPHPGDPKDSRDLGIIVPAVAEALRLADAAGFHQVHLGPVASGQYRLWNPLHPFVQTLAGIRQYFTDHPRSGIQLLELHVFSPAVWFPVVAGKVPVAEILASDVMKIWVDIRDSLGASEIHAVTARAPTKVGQLKELCGLVPDRWSTEILPRPSKDEPTDKDDLLVTPSSIVVFSPRK
ncbi:MAG TPA: SIR2 family protein [Archangium sp.]|uniref:SIR2 family protein n=1 Tax=Archangium sp. TaxID=1872627 RepID=UPI002E37FC53|nr:SIR2 family protein [Archangium sp.]HEX5752037.1 SIR2 family protein [Archangium sp.]